MSVLFWYYRSEFNTDCGVTKFGFMDMHEDYVASPFFNLDPDLRYTGRSHMSHDIDITSPTVQPTAPPDYASPLLTPDMLDGAEPSATAVPTRKTGNYATSKPHSIYAYYSQTLIR